MRRLSTWLISARMPSALGLDDLLGELQDAELLGDLVEDPLALRRGLSTAISMQRTVLADVDEARLAPLP